MVYQMELMGTLVKFIEIIEVLEMVLVVYNLIRSYKDENRICKI